MTNFRPVLALAAALGCASAAMATSAHTAHRHRPLAQQHIRAPNQSLGALADPDQAQSRFSIYPPGSRALSCFLDEMYCDRN
jgi:hypothetical protein